jgi:general secretion pathway protein C
MKRWALVATFLLFLLLCASIAYWGMQMFKPPLRPVAAPAHVANAEVRPEAAASLFGGRAGKVAVASNYQLRGVIMSGTSQDSIAILSADGKPAQAVAVGTELQPGVVVKEVHREYALLSEGGAIKRVELPENAPQGG